MKNIGKVRIEEEVDKDRFIELVKGLSLKPPVVIKPNWGFSICFTEADILDWTLEACSGDALVVESYGWARSKDMLNEGKWGSFERDDLRKGDEWFLEYSGIDRVLEKHGVEFLNITEENWVGHTAQPDHVKEAVTEKYPPLVEEDFYEQVPEKLYDLRGGTLLSLAKIRTLEAPMWVSLSVKNLFGMIPGPSRGKYHGKGHSKLSQSILDINKVYSSLFEIKGVIEAVQTASMRDPETMKWSNIENLGIASASKSPIELDAVITGMLGKNPDEVDHLKQASRIHGAWSIKAVDEALRNQFSWV